MMNVHGEKEKNWKTNKEKVLEVEDLTITFRKRNMAVTPVQGVSFDLYKGEMLGIVGESGCGKSLTARSIVGLVGKRPCEHVTGKILLQGEDLVPKTAAQMQAYCGKKVAMIFQDPMTSLNPVYTIGSQVAEVPLLHEKISRKEAYAKAVDSLVSVGIPSAEQRIHQYPHQFSGGMRQRVVSAISLIGNPEVLIADEPTTALDVTIQNQFLSLLGHLQQEYNTSIIMITHDLGVIAKICSRVNVMYAGRIIERAPVAQLFHHPRHPYTRGLLNSVPRLDTDQPLKAIPGQPPHPAHMPEGCAFHPRCPSAMPACRKTRPPLKEMAADHTVACILGG